MKNKTTKSVLDSLTASLLAFYWDSFRASWPEIPEAKARVIFDAYKGLTLTLGPGYLKPLSELPDEQIREMGKIARARQDERIAAES